MVWDRSTLWLLGGCIIRQAELGRQRGDGDLAHLQGQLQLLGGLGRRPEPMSAMASQLVPQLLDQNGLRLHFSQQKRCERPQFRRVFRQRFGDIQHARIIANPGLYGNPQTEEPMPYPADKGRQVRCGKRHLRRENSPPDCFLILLIPSSSIAN